MSGHAYDDALTENECSVSCDTGYDFSRTHLPKATCSAAGEKFVLSGCYPTTDDTTTGSRFVGTDNVGHWDTYYGIDIDSNDNVLSWTSSPDKNGNNHKLMTTGTGPKLTENQSLIGNRPVINWSGGNGHLENDNLSWVSGKLNLRSCCCKSRFKRCYCLAR